MKNFFSRFRYGTRSLKTNLALYFIPISVLPTVFISLYALRIFEESISENLIRRASADRDAIVAEIDTLEADLLAQARLHAAHPRLLEAVKARRTNSIREVIASFRSPSSIKVYSLEGQFITGKSEGRNAVSYISKEGLKRVQARGETFDRYFAPEGAEVVTVIRFLLKDKFNLLGILEEEHRYGQKELAELKNRRQVDVVFLKRDFTSAAASLALSETLVKNLSSVAFQATLKGKQPIFIQIGDQRFAAFLFDLPANFGKNRKWGYLALFLSMSTIDVTMAKLKVALLYLSFLLILTTLLAIFVFSNRLMKPIDMLVNAMKRVKTGRVEQIPSLHSTYEIEYLVHSFNEMTRNVIAAKRTLELKLEELHRANTEIKNAQSQLVQSAKMVSLGQIVAGVAHELNNPIGFIHSNMHHLSEYVEKIKELVTNYRQVRAQLGQVDQARLKQLEERLDVDFLLKDLDELTRSCVDGAKRTKDIVLGLRTFSRMEESTYQKCDIHEGLRNTLKLLASEFKDRVTLHEEYGDLPEIECNLSQMNQVFMNLLTNAVHAIERRGDIWIRTHAVKDSVVIEIEDNGSGIPAEALEKIFDPFFTTKKVGEGMGLGLSIAYGLVQKHNGAISVTSEVGKGTCFTITLPVRQKKVARMA